MGTYEDKVDSDKKIKKEGVKGLEQKEILEHYYGTGIRRLEPPRA